MLVIQELTFLKEHCDKIHSQDVYIQPANFSSVQLSSDSIKVKDCLKIWNLFLRWFFFLSKWFHGTNLCPRHICIFQGCHQLGAGRIWRITCAKQEMFVLQMCNETGRVWWNSSVERTWSMLYADWIGPSSVHIKWAPAMMMRFNFASSLKWLKKLIPCYFPFF